MKTSLKIYYLVILLIQRRPQITKIRNNFFLDSSIILHTRRSIYIRSSKLSYTEVYHSCYSGPSLSPLKDYSLHKHFETGAGNPVWSNCQKGVSLFLFSFDLVPSDQYTTALKRYDEYTIHN